MNLRSWIAFLTFRRSGIEAVARSGWRGLVLGLLFVFSAGLAREYDGEYLVAEPWHLAFPLVASTLGCLCLTGLLRETTRNARRLKVDPSTTFQQQFVSLLCCFWMTAPMAWLYAIPVERFTDPATATHVNLSLLGLVALWRVGLFIRVVQVLFGVSLVRAVFPVMLFSTVVVLAALYWIPGPVVLLMGGVRLSEGESLILVVRLYALFLCVVTIPIWLVGTLVQILGRAWRWRLEEMAAGSSRDRAPSTGGLGLWCLAILSIGIWLPILPLTQAEQRLRYRAESLLVNEQFDAFASLTHSVEQHDFPPHWDMPPRPAWGQRRPNLLRLFPYVIQNDVPQWVRTAVANKLLAEVDAFKFQLRGFEELSDEELSAFVDALERVAWGDRVAYEIWSSRDWLTVDQPESSWRKRVFDRLEMMANRAAARNQQGQYP